MCIYISWKDKCKEGTININLVVFSSPLSLFIRKKGKREYIKGRVGRRAKVGKKGDVEGGEYLEVKLEMGEGGR